MAPSAAILPYDADLLALSASLMDVDESLRGPSVWNLPRRG